MRKNALLIGGLLLIVVAVAGLYFGYDVKQTAEGEGPSEKWLWVSFAFQLTAGLCFLWQHFSLKRSKGHPTD
ncbi:hypothetical protein [Indiicoccus explosivorum]|uniref:hypothetical protein n=1 Tax=Indiicoccus explosivorum TaxID=1917864 RepID=UPI00118647BE|nr:hypothetical protein [Indiicoccus explosivorum]